MKKFLILKDLSSDSIAFFLKYKPCLYTSAYMSRKRYFLMESKDLVITVIGIIVNSNRNSVNS